MADLTPYSYVLGNRNYPTTHQNFLNYLLPFLNDIEGARNGEATMLARIQKCMVLSSGFTQEINANGNRLRNLPTPVNPDEPATKAFAESLAFSSALPAVSSATMGEEITNDGATAEWGASSYSAFGILNSMGYF